MNKWKIRDCCRYVTPAHGEECSIQHYVIKFVNDLRHVGGFLWELRFPPLITEILLKVALITINNPCFQQLFFIIDVLHSVSLTIRDTTSDVICEYIYYCLLH